MAQVRAAFDNPYSHSITIPKLAVRLLDALAAVRSERDRMREAATAERDQFRFYENEHLKAGKTEKALTNAAYAHALDRALQGDTE